MYFQNTRGYMLAVASLFNGFPTTENFYVCSVPPECFPNLSDTRRVGTDNVMRAVEEENKD